ncbi:CNH domain-containing protein [Roridomyces roridus]|uniref:CNH domain-containing protein n=1 Tax=Roridomyces roridus TaxID=1738132 RepID=A0AAD7FIA4_9AGAR|nr:CNH domain-containing protein [Roridomyces roridus]
MSLSSILFSKISISKRRTINAPSSTPLPKDITDQISTELYEHILECLVPDAQSLVACALVCPSWTPRSRFLLLESTVCHPVHINHHGFGSTKIVWASTYCDSENENRLIYATMDGVYRGSRDGRTSLRLWSHPNISRFEILVDANLFLCLAGGVFLTIPFSTLKAGTCQPSDVIRINERVSYFTVAPQNMPDGSSRSSIIKTFNVNAVESGQQTSPLVTTREFYIPCESHSAQFLRRNLAVALKRDKLQLAFEVVNLTNLDTTTLLSPSPSLDLLPRNSKPMGLYRISNIFLKVGFYIDRGGNMIRNELVMRWESTCVSFALHEPYILAFSETQIGLWNIETAEIVQRIHGPYHLLNVPQSGERVLVGHSNDVVEIVFRDE